MALVAHLNILVLLQIFSTGRGFSCPAAEKPPPIPEDALDLNGVAWPAACFEGDETHFFIIGDWGGVFPHTTFDNNKHAAVPGIDKEAQINVATKMAEIAKTSRPKYVLNVGDNIYPGGIGLPGVCNISEGKFEASGQAGIVMKGTYEDVYKGDGLDGVEWWGILGNHDFGGYAYSTHWDQFIFYTWGTDGLSPKRWITPAMYWSRNVQYDGFSVDYFFLDSNICDVKDPPADPEHNICNNVHNKPDQACNGTNISSPATCQTFFEDLWDKQKAWLTDLLEKSKADWQIIVSHYPPTFDPAQDFWKEIFPKYGVDVYVCGHTHQQTLMYKGEEFGDTAYIISGGGGGIFSEILPTTTGEDDAYGFVDVTISKTQLKVEMYSAGGLEHKTIIRNTTIVTPRQRATARQEVRAEVVI